MKRAIEILLIIFGILTSVYISMVLSSCTGLYLLGIENMGMPAFQARLPDHKYILSMRGSDNYHEFVSNKIFLFILKEIEYKEDEIYNQYPDYWQTPDETMKRKTGDCEDKAIFAMWLFYVYTGKKLTFYSRDNGKKAHAYAKGYGVSFGYSDKYDGWPVRYKYNFETTMKLAYYYHRDY